MNTQDYIRTYYTVYCDKLFHAPNGEADSYLERLSRQLPEPWFKLLNDKINEVLTKEGDIK